MTADKTPLLEVRGVSKYFGNVIALKDVSVSVGDAHDDGQVFFFHLTRFELGGECVVGLVILGDDDDAARFAIKPMDDAGTRRAAAAAERAEVVGQRAGERALPMALGGVDDHSGPFVDDDDRIVFVEDVERDVLRSGAFAGRGDLVDDDDISVV